MRTLGDMNLMHVPVLFTVGYCQQINRLTCNSALNPLGTHEEQFLSVLDLYLEEEIILILVNDFFYI